MKSLYDFPQVYEAVLQRPADVIEREVCTILDLLADHGITGGKLLELACGACPHGILLAQAGFQVVGLDRAPAMLAAAQRRAAEAGIPVRTVQGDVVGFDLDECAFEAAILMFETFPLIARIEGIVRHFDAVRRHLRSGSVYIVDVDASREGMRTQVGEWGRRALSLPGGTVETWYEDLPGNWIEGTNHVILHARICLDGQVHETRDDWTVHVYHPWDLALLARALDSWELDGFYSWRDASHDISDDDHYFAIFAAR